MTEHAPGRIWSGIDIPKTVAGVLAAVSAAVIGSFLGVAGTLVGAAVASLISSVGTEVYHRIVDRGHKKLRGTFTTAPAAVGTPPVAATAEESPSDSSQPPFSMRWKRVAMVAGALFVLAMGTLTLAEAISGRSVADATGGETGERWTISGVFTSSSSDDEDNAPVPATTDSATEPAEEPATEPTEQPATEPTTAPETEAPTDGGTTDPGTGTGTGTEVDPGAGSGNQNTDTQGADTQNLEQGTE